jgi:hypothetical protein
MRGKSSTNGQFSKAMLNYQRVYIYMYVYVYIYLCYISHCTTSSHFMVLNGTRPAGTSLDHGMEWELQMEDTQQ